MSGQRLTKYSRNYFGNQIKVKKYAWEGLIGEPPTDKELTIGTLIKKKNIGFKNAKIKE